MKRKTKALIVVLTAGVGIFCLFYFLYRLNVIPHRSYTNADFDIPHYTSSVDADGDGIDDQTDILQNVRTYIGTKPKYKSNYYPNGYPDDGCGVCTDVVAFGLLGAGYDLKELVEADYLAAPEAYPGIGEADPAIDFRRVANLKVYFARNAISLTTDVNDIAEWQGGAIVIFEKHIGVVSDKRNRKGIAFVIHHANPWQRDYEEDILETWGDIVGHYRVSE